MDPGELEALALEALRRADADPEEPPPVFEIVRALLGTKVERPAHMVTLGATHRLHGRTFVSVKASLSIQRAQHVAGHELAHILIREAALHLDDEERAADYLGACLMMPRPYVVKFHRAEGFAPAALAEELATTQTAAALRIAEVVNVPLAAVSPALVRVRGPESFVWGDEDAAESA